MDKTPVNPTLSDIFQTAITAAKPLPAERRAPNIVVRGDGNVFSWGGAVHVNGRTQPVGGQEPE